MSAQPRFVFGGLTPYQQGQGSPVLIPSSPSRSASHARKEASASQWAEAAALETQRVCLSASFPFRERQVPLPGSIFPGSPAAFRTVSRMKWKLHLNPQPGVAGLTGRELCLHLRPSSTGLGTPWDSTQDLLQVTSVKKEP